jgi:hypothetical protein
MQVLANAGRVRSSTMRTFDDLVLRLAFVALFLLAASQALAGCGASPAATELGLALPHLDIAIPKLPEPASTLTVPAHDERASWCEPLDPPFCRITSDCPSDSKCVRPWWAETDESKVCSRGIPDRDERRWRAERLRVYVDHVCTRSTGCDPNDLHAYLRALVLRESTWRPWVRTKLEPDLEANAIAWSKHRHKFAGNPAAKDPDRWITGLGYFSQIPALWLPRWDASAPPEVLCGEVESSEVHLRAARAQVAKIWRGVDCDGDHGPDFWGTSCGDGRPPHECSPSWYDASRTNSGSLCPGDADHRRRFAARASSLGLDPWAPINASDLGQSIPRDRQDAIASDLREVMDLVGREPADATPRSPRSR